MLQPKQNLTSRVLQPEPAKSYFSASMEPMPDPVRLRQRLRVSLKVALKARDSIAVAAFRSAMSAVDNAEAVGLSQESAPTRGMIAKARLGVGSGEVPRRALSAQDVLEVVRAEVADRTAAAAEYERLGRAEEARRLQAEATALESFLETALTDP
jgi:uncharacterized protein YqeY